MVPADSRAQPTNIRKSILTKSYIFVQRQDFKQELAKNPRFLTIFKKCQFLMIRGIRGLHGIGA